MQIKKLTAALGALAVLVAAASLLVPGLASAKPATAKATAVTVTGKEFKFTLSKKTVPHGAVTFTFKNAGKLPHDFKIGGKKTAILKPGKHAILKVNFKHAGRYAYMCTVPGHAAAGMKGVLRVK
jgi:uncharacterized cupredoxin-like copper-binding protein